ncbi:uncharacterized protein Dana_GF27183 [Drosophila ananassae]|uniref:Uncharacterized protein n=1 Tax=Drosophila ananassae TaxID=7217 RepID=A0A0P8XH34_DROAN|nr:uncharacterized protein Dana_GF27183 [Drosophila ananassae]
MALAIALALKNENGDFFRRLAVRYCSLLFSFSFCPWALVPFLSFPHLASPHLTLVFFVVVVVVSSCSTLPPRSRSHVHSSAAAAAAAAAVAAAAAAPASSSSPAAPSMRSLVCVSLFFWRSVCPLISLLFPLSFP